MLEQHHDGTASGVAVDAPSSTATAVPLNSQLLCGVTHLLLCWLTVLLTVSACRAGG